MTFNLVTGVQKFEGGFAGLARVIDGCERGGRTGWGWALGGGSAWGGGLGWLGREADIAKAKADHDDQDDGKNNDLNPLHTAYIARISCGVKRRALAWQRDANP